MAFQVPDLPYVYDALEPTIDAETMKLHHDKHHQAYVDKANAALSGTEYESADVETVLANLDRLPADKQKAVRNNAGGHANHTLFWESMGQGKGGAPSGELASAIDSAFGSFDDFKKTFEENGVNQFGSGWTWLVSDGGSLVLISTPNQDSPLLDGKTPLLGNDVWEHAYYLKYNNRRPDYLKAWWDVVDWGVVGRRFSSAKA